MSEALRTYEEAENGKFEADSAEMRGTMLDGLGTATAAFLVWQDEEGTPHAGAFGADGNRLPYYVARAADSYLSEFADEIEVTQDDDGINRIIVASAKRTRRSIRGRGLSQRRRCRR